MVIFGASGDLTARKLMPALYNLALNRYLPSGFSVIGVADTALSEEEFRSNMADAVRRFSRTQPVDRAVWQSVAEGLSYVRMSFDDPEAYGRLAAELDRLDRERGTNGNRVFYFATAPRFFPVIVERLGASGIARTGAGWKRVVIEKPFGHDLKTAKELNQTIHSVFAEPQVYRIDHYLGKETVQNGPGWVGGQQVPGYRQEQNVSPNSTTETYVAVRLKIDNWRWADTPFYLRTGKRLPSRASEIAIQFKSAPHQPFAKTAIQGM